MTRTIDIRLIIFLLAVNTVYAERIKDMIYTSFDGVSACFRKHNATHQFGCSSARSGSVGVIQLLDSPTDLQWLEDKAKAGPYTVVMPLVMFKVEILDRLRATNNINGILLAGNSSALPESYSPEDTCPNRYSGYKTCNSAKPWNPLGSGFLMEDWPFPMFYLQNDTLVEEIRSCYQKYNAHDTDRQSERSLCAVEMKSFMYSALNSESCLRRSTMWWNFNPTQFCEPLGDTNIHWPVGPLTNNTESVILVSARLDSNSMFDGLAPGANSAISALVALIATAFHLNSLEPTVGKTNVIFSMFNGEAFDYIGSSRMAYDLKQGRFTSIGGVNLELEKIDAMIELGQLGGVDELFLHANNHKGNSLIEQLQKRFSLENSTLEDSVPPASIQSFLSVKPNLTAVVLANHGDHFSNKYYHSLLDNAETVGFNSTEEHNKLSAGLGKIAIKLGDLLYSNITGKEAPQANSSHTSHVEDLISEMLSCYLVNSSCALFRAVATPGATASLYVGVSRAPNHASTIAAQLLDYFTGKQVPNVTASECNEKYFSWMPGPNFTGICINSTINYSSAISPAFIIDDYDLKSGKYSSWTESIWDVLSVRMFLKPSAASERLTITLGSVVAILSFIIVWFVNSRADILFDNGRGEDY